VGHHGHGRRQQISGYCHAIDPFIAMSRMVSPADLTEPASVEEYMFRITLNIIINQNRIIVD
jgi:hypothetical protein